MASYLIASFLLLLLSLLPTLIIAFYKILLSSKGDVINIINAIRQTRLGRRV